MILQALTRYYEILCQDPERDIAPPGFNTVEVSYVIELSARGELLNLLPLFEQVQVGKKLVERPKRMIVPEQTKHTNSISAFFLCDNATYVLGITDRQDTKDPDYGRKRFEEFRRFNCELLEQADCEPARAVIAFLSSYDPSLARTYPAIDREWDSLVKGARLVFMVQGKYVHENSQILNVWERHLAKGDAVLGQCLVTGEKVPIARLHPPLKGVKNANTTGAPLVGFNARAYESFNRIKGQGFNSPVGEKAAFAYTKALNYLLSHANPNKKFYIGDTTVVYWAESENPGYASAFASLFAPEFIEEVVIDPHAGRRKAESRMGEVAKGIRRVQAMDVSRLTEGLDKNTRFYVLGLSPNAARIAVRFFLTDSFGKIVDRIMQHYRDLAIIKEFDNQPNYIPPDHILRETVSKKSREKDASPLMSGAVTRAILSGAPYPAALYNAMINRIRADMDDSEKGIRKINYVRAAVIKAYLIRKYRHQPQHPYQEVLVMSLNEQSKVPAYVLGRLFAELERAQQEAVGDVNASIKDRYFTSACASPASVFPVLLRLSQHHIAKAEHGRSSDRRIQDILGLLDVENNPIPARLTLDEQGIFVLGYYHQRAAFYTPRQDSEPVDEAAAA